MATPTIPTIYCNTKQALPTEEITVIAAIGSVKWTFNTTDIDILEGSLSSNTLTFKCQYAHDPLIINCLVANNVVINGSAWNTTVIEYTDILGDNWTTPTICQENLVLTGWNFEGRSQRVDQTLSGVPSITQSNLTVSGGEYTVEIDYRANVDLELTVGGNTFELSATNEGQPFAIYPIQHGTGLFQIVTDGVNPRWTLADGTHLTSNVAITTIGSGTSYYTCDDFSTVTITVMDGMDGNYIGDTSDIPSGVAGIVADGIGMLGNLSELAHVRDNVTLDNCDDIVGSVASLSNVSNIISLVDSYQISGDVVDLSQVRSKIDLTGTMVSGIISSSNLCVWIVLDNTGLSKEELEASLVNLAACGVVNGYFRCIDGMPTVDTVDACRAKYELEQLYGWTVEVNSNCEGPY